MKRKQYKKNSGFTLIELLVVIGIFILVTSTVIFDYGSFRSNTALNNLASDVGLSVRKAQSYAIGAYGQGANFNYAYGVHFSTASVPVIYPQRGSSKAFMQFTDISGNRLYNSDGITLCSATAPTSSNECTERLDINGTSVISAIYLNSSSTPIPTGGSVDIVFVRPNPDAYFCYRSDDSHSSCDAPTSISNVKIELSDAVRGVANGVRYVTIWSTGQISTQ